MTQKFILFCILLLQLQIIISEINLGVYLFENRKDFNYDIFGVNHADEQQLESVPYPVNRKGGNAETRYNWEKGISNRAKDWFFMNIVDDVPNPALLPEGTSATQFVDLNKRYNSKTMLTASLIGWTPLDEREKKWGFSITKYGNQQQNECTVTGYPSWCTEDAGNGVLTNNQKITWNDPRDTSKPIDETYVQDWIRFLAQRGTPVDYWSLDNEMDLWHDTHRDVHPNHVTYDEMWSLTKKYASAIKAANPNAVVFGPVNWGWCTYFYSPADDCKVGSDRLAHGDVPIIPWYLQQLSNHEKTEGQRLVDYLDIHYYPQATGVYDPQQTVDHENIAALRLRTVKSLYDPSYIDESWIAEAEPVEKAVKLIPRMKDWIKEYYPEIKLAITEYNFGNDVLMSSAIAQAEVLAVFAREGVDLACRWVAPAINSHVEKAFKIYLNYDGKGSRIQGQIVHANSSDINSVGIYAFHHSPSNTAYIVLINKKTSNTNVQISMKEVNNDFIQLYGFSAEDTVLKNFQNITSGTGLINMNLRGRSVTLAVVKLTTPVDPIDPVDPDISPKPSPIDPDVSPISPEKSPKVKDSPSTAASNNMSNLFVLMISLVLLMMY